MKKVLFIDSVHPLIREELSAHGCTCDPAQDRTKEELMKIIKKATSVKMVNNLELKRLTDDNNQLA